MRLVAALRRFLAPNAIQLAELLVGELERRRGDVLLEMRDA